MKKLLLLFVAALTLASCDNDDDYPNLTYEFMPTESADIPEDMFFYANNSDKISYEITIHYNRPSSCYIFNDLYYASTTENIDDENGEDGEESIATEIRTIAVINVFNEDNLDCMEYSGEEGQSTATFKFIPGAPGPYIFKFWTGTNDEGEDEFLEYETVILEE